MSHTPELSIIIPTLNEERYLPKLLWSIKEQTYRDHEVIVVDSNSKDNTARYAKLLGARVFSTDGRVSKARNIGAENAQGARLLFLDADAVFQHPTFLMEFLERVRALGAKCAWVPHIPVERGIKPDLACRLTTAYYVAKNVYPTGYFLYVEKEIFDKVKFDESLNSGEAIDWASRANEYCDIVQIPMPIATSMRRAEKYGYIGTAIKAAGWFNNERVIKKLDQEYPVGEFE